MSLRKAAAVAALLGIFGAEGAVVQKQLRQQLKEEPTKALGPESFVKALEFKHSLRVCNAYPYAAALSIYRGKTEQLTGDTPMPYKTCRDFKAPLIAGDKLEFKIGDASAGTFSVSDLPNDDAVLLLVIHRHDTLSTAVAFESHVFANTDAAQVAVIDTYKGGEQATPKITDSTSLVAAPGDKKKEAAAAALDPRTEELRFDSVVAINPGLYEIALDATDGHEEARKPLVALGHESYVVLRTGVQSMQGPSYPQELVIFPNPSPNALHGAAWGRSGVSLAAILVALVARLFA